MENRTFGLGYGSDGFDTMPRAEQPAPNTSQGGGSFDDAMAAVGKAFLYFVAGCVILLVGSLGITALSALVGEVSNVSASTTEVTTTEEVTTEATTIPVVEREPAIPAATADDPFAALDDAVDRSYHTSYELWADAPIATPVRTIDGTDWVDARALWTEYRVTAFFAAESGADVAEADSGFAGFTDWYEGEDGPVALVRADVVLEYPREAAATAAHEMAHVAFGYQVFGATRHDWATATNSQRALDLHLRSEVAAFAAEMLEAHDSGYYATVERAISEYGAEHLASYTKFNLTEAQAANLLRQACGPGNIGHTAWLAMNDLQDVAGLERAVAASA